MYIAGDVEDKITNFDNLVDILYDAEALDKILESQNTEEWLQTKTTGYQKRILKYLSDKILIQ